VQSVGVGSGSSWRVPQAPTPRPDAARRSPLHATKRREGHWTAAPGSRLHRSPIARLALCVAGLALTGVLAAHLLTGTDGQGLSLIDREAIAHELGIAIEQVSVVGQRHTADADVFEALDLPNVRSMLHFDSRAARARIERLPWVATAALTRLHPGQLEVRLTERKPFALWQRGERHFIIDETGRVLAAVPAAAMPDLPRVAGEGAAAEAGALFAELARAPHIKARLEVAERIAERRWTLHLSGGATVHLPADRETRALEALVADARLTRLLARPGSVVDLRAPARAAVRSAAPPDLFQTSQLEPKQASAE
jgi:cell division protein FtsQ